METDSLLAVRLHILPLPSLNEFPNYQKQKTKKSNGVCNTFWAEFVKSDLVWFVASQTMKGSTLRYIYIYIYHTQQPT